MPRRDFRELLGSSLDALRRDVPAAYERLADALAELPLALEVDGVKLRLVFADGEHALQGPGEADVLLKTSRPAILDLVDGRATLVGALRAERLWLQGAPGAVVRFDHALRAYLAGAVRSRAFPELLSEYR